MTARLRADYEPVADPSPRYGDLLILARPDGTIVHSAVCVADDVFYTKNGDTPVHPWMLATLDDLLKQYGCWVRPGETLQVGYFRRRP